MHVPNQTEGRWLTVQIIARRNYSNPGREWKGSWCITTGAWALFSFTTMDRSTAMSLAHLLLRQQLHPDFRWPPPSSVLLLLLTVSCVGFSPVSTARAAPKQLQLHSLTIGFGIVLTRADPCSRLSGMCELSLVQEGIYKVLLVNISLCWKIGLRREKSRAGSKLDTFTTKYQGSSSFSKETKNGIFNCW